jgi:hypothetical protein
MTRLLMAVVATAVALGLSGDVATAADAPAQASPSDGKSMWKSCARVGESDRDLCMVNVSVKDSAAARQCEELMGRAQRRCMLDFLEGKRPMPTVK